MAWLTLPIAALAAGVISFSSPCSVPLVPSYLSFLSGLPVSELDAERARRLTIRAALLFVAGFTLVFTLLGASSALVGAALLRNLPLLTRLGGVFLIVLGLATVGAFRIPALQHERRMDLGRFARGPRSAFPVGMAFALGWVPCIGPVLASVLTIAAATETVAWGALLLALYSVGLGAPFVLLALGFRSLNGSVSWLRRNSRKVEIIGGAFLILVGVLFVTGAWLRLFVPLQREFARLGWPPV